MNMSQLPITDAAAFHFTVKRCQPKYSSVRLHIYANFKHFNSKAKIKYGRGQLYFKSLTFRPSLAWQFTFRGVSKAISFSSLPLL